MTEQQKPGNKNTIAMADSFMKIFGYTRVATQSGNVITPVEFEQCDICGDNHDGEVPRECETGDGV